MQNDGKQIKGLGWETIRRSDQKDKIESPTDLAEH